MQASEQLPHTERVSVLAAVILLAYSLTRFVDFPARTIEAQLPGFYLAVELNIRLVVLLLVAGLTASGANWLLHEHPKFNGQSTIQHWLLPSLTAWVIGAVLYQLPYGIFWWLGLFTGGFLLMLVLLAEYRVLDPQDVGYNLAAAGLTALAFALFLALAITLHTGEVRLFLRVPLLTGSALLVSLRTLHLRLNGKWAIWQAATAAVITMQLAAALHYWPVNATGFGLGVVGPVYALTSLTANLSEGNDLRSAAFEPLVVLVVSWGLAAWFQ